MKQAFTFLLLLLASRQGFAQPVINASADFQQLKWLQGEWKRVNAKPGNNDHERWTIVSSSELNGWGVSMNGRDTGFAEKLTLLVKDNTIFYVADTPDNKDPVYFKLTLLTKNSFVCENPAHDFPRKIAYYHKGNAMKAIISGNGKTIVYNFIRR
jgi:Domain of unknown function (DUF6265)